MEYIRLRTVSLLLLYFFYSIFFSLDEEWLFGCRLQNPFIFCFYSFPFSFAFSIHKNVIYFIQWFLILSFLRWVCVSVNIYNVLDKEIKMKTFTFSTIINNFLNVFILFFLHFGFMKIQF